MYNKVRHPSAPRPAPPSPPQAPQAQPTPLIREVLGLWLKPGSWLRLDGKGSVAVGWGQGDGAKSTAPPPPPASHSDFILLFLVHEGELLVRLPGESDPGPIRPPEGRAALLQDA